MSQNPRASEIVVDPTGLTHVTSTNTQGAIGDLDAAVTAATYTDEQVRDVIGAALVAGSNVTITVSDPGNTITIAATGGGGSLTVQDENSNVSTSVTQIDFQGAGVTASAGTGEVIVTIPGGGGSAASYATRSYARATFR